MSQPEALPNAGTRPRAWVLAAPGAGDNRQLEALGELVGADVRWIASVDTVGRVLGDRLTGFRAERIPEDKRAEFQPPWPDLVLIAGGRSVIDARRIVHASGGKSRIVCLGRPWAPLEWFALVITTPQYRLPATKNVITIDLPLNPPKTPSHDELEHWRAEFGPLPRPLVGVLLGGDSGSYRFTDACARSLAHELDRVLETAGGSAVVVASPRTPNSAVDALEATLSAPARICRWNTDGPNPMASLLELADAFVVTGDSASMLAEASHGGKPVAVVDLHERFRSRLNRALRHATPFLQPLFDALTRRGLWFPARDMPELHRRARAAGRVVPLERLLSESPESRTTPAPDDTHAEIAERIRGLLKPAQSRVTLR